MHDDLIIYPSPLHFRRTSALRPSKRMAMSAAKVQQIVQVLMTPDAQQFEDFLRELMNPDNTRRKFAEAVLVELKKHPDLFVRYLISTVRHSEVVAFRAFSAMLLRKCLTIETPLMWTALSDPVKYEVKSELLNALRAEKIADVLFKTADAVSELARYLLSTGRWPELHQALFQLMEGSESHAVVTAFRIIGSLAENTDFEIFNATGQMLVTAIERAILTGPVPVKSEAISAMCRIASEKGQVADALRPMVPKVIEALLEFLKNRDETAAETVMESLIDVAEEAPRFLKPSLKEILPSLLKVTLSDSIDKSMRILAAEVLISIAEQKDQGLGNLFRAMPNFAECLFEALMVFLLDIEDLPKWHTAEDEDEDAGNGELFDFGMESLDRLALSFGGRVLVPIAGAMLSGCINDPSWQKRQASFICLSQIAEGCDKVMLQEIDALTDMCMNGLSDTMPKVRWAACQAIGQMCTDLSPDIQGSQHEKIIPKLKSVMEDAQHPRVQAHAAAAIVNFCDECEEDDILPYLDALVPTFIQLLHSPSRLVAESALTALASVADSANEHFGAYYDAVMPLLRTMFAQATDPKHRYLRAKALECISLVGMAVGADRFRQDASEVMQLIHQLHQAHFDPSDPLPGYMIQAGARMCRSLGREFLPYLEIVMPLVLNHIKADPEIKITDPLNDNSDDDDSETFHVGGKLVRLRSSAMEEKATACEMVASYAGVLKDGFLPYVKEITDVVVPMLKFIFSDEVRSGAFQCLPELLDAALTGMKNGAGVTLDFVKQMVEFIWPAAIDALKNEDELEVIESALRAIAAMVDILTPELLSETMVSQCFDTLRMVFSESEDRRKQRIEGLLSDEEDDFEEYENVPPTNHDDEEEMETDVLDEVATVLSSFMKRYGDAVITYIVGSMPFVHALLGKGRSAVERRIAICVVDDILEHCPQAGNNYLHEFLPFLIEGASNEDASLRQCSVYGLGVVASKYPEAFQPHIPELLPNLIRAVQHPSAKSRENEMATDNIVSTIGKIIQQFPDKVDPEVVDQVWLKNLPLLHDDLEARNMHALLVTMVEQQDVRVLGGNNKNLVHIVEVTHYQQKSESVLMCVF